MIKQSQRPKWIQSLMVGNCKYYKSIVPHNGSKIVRYFRAIPCPQLGQSQNVYKGKRQKLEIEEGICLGHMFKCFHVGFQNIESGRVFCYMSFGKADHIHPITESQLMLEKL